MRFRLPHFYVSVLLYADAVFHSGEKCIKPEKRCGKQDVRRKPFGYNSVIQRVLAMQQEFARTRRTPLRLGFTHSSSSRNARANNVESPRIQAQPNAREPVRRFL